jgi:hypothetical protein
VVLLNIAGRGKLGPKYYRPFHVSEHIDDVAYKLKLPQGTKLHDMFHVALLKTFHAPPPLKARGFCPQFVMVRRAWSRSKSPNANSRGAVVNSLYDGLGKTLHTLLGWTWTTSAALIHHSSSQMS